MTLAEVRQGVSAALRQALADKAAAFRNLAVATVDGEGRPCIRTVVLRDADLDARCLCFHTDSRSAKVGQLQRNPAVELHGWDPSSQVQIRMDGTAALHRADAAAAGAWAGLHEGTRRTYRVRPAPGTPIATPDAIPRDLADDAAYAQFTLVVVRLNVVEWLCLRQPGHLRARFTWDGGQEHATWLVP